ncbi:MAG: MoaD/ThiS family protein [Planctomycetota bacterium]|nr:MAG: MoaD/ThiS family protein [Planctomycetota bacterium]
MRLTVTLDVLLFAGVRQAAGSDRISLDVPEPVTIGSLRGALAERLPKVADLIQVAMFAIGTEYADDDTVVPAGSTVACIPPVSGG